MALGAQPRRVVRLIVSKGMSVGLIGIGVGLLGALVVTRLMASLVYGVPLHDGATFVGVAIILTPSPLWLASFPARLAAKVDPMVALRHE